MKFQLSCLAVVCTLSLAACSNSGSSTGKTAAPSENNTVNTITAQTNNTQNNTTTVSPNTPSTPNTPPTTTTPSVPSTPSTPPSTTTPSAPSTPSTPPSTTTPSTPSTPSMPPTASGTYVGNAVVTQNLAASDVVTHSLQSNTMNSIVVDGKNIRLDLAGTELNGFTHTNHSTAELTGVGKQMKYLRFGYDINYLPYRQGKVPAYSFVIGSLTPASDMPNSGTAKYEGNAVVRPTGDGENAGFIQSYSAFNVNFGNKSLDGLIKYSGNESENILVSGTINGTSFSGTRNGIKTQGHFYGPQAAELGGTFSGPITFNGAASNATGAFGAAKK